MSHFPKIKRPKNLTPKHKLTWSALNGAAELTFYMLDLTPLETVTKQSILDAAESGDLYRMIIVMSGVSQMTERRLLGTMVLHKLVDEWLVRTEDLILNDLYHKNKQPITFSHFRDRQSRRLALEEKAKEEQIENAKSRGQNDVGAMGAN
jgi:hypothetical protein